MGHPASNMGHDHHADSYQGHEGVTEPIMKTCIEGDKDASLDLTRDTDDLPGNLMEGNLGGRFGSNEHHGQG